MTSYLVNSFHFMRLVAVNLPLLYICVRVSKIHVLKWLSTLPQSKIFALWSSVYEKNIFVTANMTDFCQKKVFEIENWLCCMERICKEIASTKKKKPRSNYSPYFPLLVVVSHISQSYLENLKICLIHRVSSVITNVN